MDTCPNSVCKKNVPVFVDRCPHCGASLPVPNVRAAERPIEKAALQRRYDAAIQDAKHRDTETITQQFEQSVAQSQAVIARPIGEIDRLTSSDRELYTSYYHLVSARQRLPEDAGMSLLRAVADETVFHGYKEQVRFAALTIDGKGLKNYGDFFMVLREEMIAGRANFFEENSVLWMKRHNLNYNDFDKLPPGSRATWPERGRLAVAKLGTKLETTTTSSDFTALLLQSGATSEQDDFIEVHIYGDLSIHSVKQLILDTPRRKMQKHEVKKLEGKIKDLGADVEVIT
jgi:hypothetical protein